MTPPASHHHHAPSRALVERRRRLRRVVLAEVAGLLALLRRNRKWASAENPLVANLQKLRDATRAWDHNDGPASASNAGADGAASASGGAAALLLLAPPPLDPLDALMPFLELVRSGEASGPFTGAALKATACLLRAGLLDHDEEEDDDDDEEGRDLQAEHRRDRRAQAAAELVDAVVHCRFEETDAEMDEVVRMRIIELLAEAVDGPAGPLLTDGAVWEVVQTCFINRNEVAHSRMLCHAAERALLRVVRAVFRTTAQVLTPTTCEDAAASSGGGKRRRGGEHSSPSASSSSYGLPCAVKIFAFLSSQLLQGFHQHGSSGGLSLSASSGAASMGAPTGHSSGSVSGSSSSAAAGGRQHRAYHESTRLVCLRMLREALEVAGGPALARCPSLLALVRDDLCLAVLRMTRGGFAIEILCEALGVVRCLWASLRRHLKMQFECLFSGVFLRLLLQIKAAYAPPPLSATSEAEAAVAASNPLLGGGGDRKYEYKPAEQQVILETLADLLAEPAALPDLFYNYDCDTQRADLLEGLVRALAACAQAIDPDAPHHRLAAEQLHNGGGSLGDRPPPDWEQGLTLRERCMEALLQLLRQLYLRCDDAAGEKDEGAAAPPSVPVPLPAGEGVASLNKLSSEAWQRKQWKRILQRGAEQFNEKPRLGLKYLLAQGVMPEPLTPTAAASFLRTAPGLDPAAVGSYLGEVGVPPEQEKAKGGSVFLADTQAFHEGTLRAFVATFHFEGQPLLGALRMFLAAFRLPKEAQQIDRVLQAFAEAAFEQCAEARAGQLASADVAYLLSFSIIMLNTDLHNPNIRPEKRMTPADFVRNNRNYGKDISKGKDLPVEFLEGIYKSIQEHPILSFDARPDGSDMTVDRWRDLLKQAEADPDTYGLLVCHEPGANDDGEGPKASAAEAGRIASPPPSLASPTAAAAMGSSARLAAEEHARRHGYAAYDREVVQWLWRPFLAVAVKSFVGGYYDTDVAGNDKGGEADGVASAIAAAGASAASAAGAHHHGHGYALGPHGTAFLRQCVDATLLVAKVTAAHGLQSVFDTVLYLLCGFTGLLGDPPLRASPDMPWDLQQEDDEEVDALLSSPEAAHAHLQRQLRRSLQARDKLYGRLLFRFVHSAPAQMALVSAFGIAHRLGDHLRAGWRPLLLLVFRLRDMRVLGPEALVEGENGLDSLLTPEGRAHFQQALRQAVLAHLRKEATAPQAQQEQEQHTAAGQEEGGADAAPAPLPSTQPQQRRGFLGGLLVSLFASGSGTGSEAERLARLVTDSPELEAWNDAYGGQQPPQQEQDAAAAVVAGEEGGEAAGEGPEGCGSPTEEQDLVIVGQPGTPQQADGSAHTSPRTPARGPQGPSPRRGAQGGGGLLAHARRPLLALAESPTPFYVKSLAHCRALVRGYVAPCRVQELVAESRFVGQEALLALLQTLVDLVHAHEGLPPMPPTTADGMQEKDGEAATDAYITRIRKEVPLPAISPASAAYAEVLVAEIALRNRDRAPQLWAALLARHYHARLAGCRRPSLGVEKAATGLLRLAVRLFGREVVAAGEGSPDGQPALKLADPMADALTWLLPPTLPSPEASRLLSPLLAAGLWRLIPANLPSLPALSLHGWRQLVRALEVCAPVGGETTARAFEVLCFLLHEPQLKGAVPVPCAVAAVLAFVRCPNGPDALARAALDLLMVLHARLDAAVHSPQPAQQHALLTLAGLPAPPPTPPPPPLTPDEAWPLAWAAVLDALAAAARDPRLGVRCHALTLLTEALLDQQSRHVGAPALARALAEIAIPLARLVVSTPAAATRPYHPPLLLAQQQQQQSGQAGGSPPRQPQPRAGSPMAERGGGGHTALRAKELALSMVCQAFLSHLRELLPLPHFHELWLQVLDLLEAFLGQPPLSPEQLHQLQLQQQLKHAQAAMHGHAPPPTPTGGSQEWRVELAPLSELALEKLKNLLLVMSAAGAFAPGEETIGAELWALTWAVVDDRFRFCPGLRGELFGGAEGEQVGAAEPSPAPPQEPPQEQQQQPPPEPVPEPEALAAELTGPLPPEEQEEEGPVQQSSVEELGASSVPPSASPDVGGGDVSSLFPPLPPHETGAAGGFAGKGAHPMAAVAAVGAEAPIPEGADRRAGAASSSAQIV